MKYHKFSIEYVQLQRSDDDCIADSTIERRSLIVPEATSDLALIRRAKKLFNWNGLRTETIRIGDTIRLQPVAAIHRDNALDIDLEEEITRPDHVKTLFAATIDEMNARLRLIVSNLSWYDVIEPDELTASDDARHDAIVSDVIAQIMRDYELDFITDYDTDDDLCLIAQQRGSGLLVNVWTRCVGGAVDSLQGRGFDNSVDWYEEV